MSSTNIWEFVGAFFLSIGGATVLVGGLSAWLGQLWAKRILAGEAFVRSKELEKVRADLDEKLQNVSATLEHRSHVSKAQFDLEFKLYQELWNKLETLRATSIKLWVPLRTAVVSGTLSQPQLNEAVTQQTAVEALYQSYIEYFLSQSPFISQSVKDWIDENAKVLGAMNGVCKMAIEAAAHNRVADFDQIEAAQLQYNAVHATFADAIRQRLASVSIIT